MINNRLISLDQYFSIDYSSKLGEGATGCVFLGYNKKNNQPVAVKVIELSKINTEIMQYLHHMEITALTMLDNPYLIKCYGIVQNQTHSFIISELYNGVTLSDEIKQKGPISENKSLDLLSCILKGYQEILNNKILHRDMKTDNIMIHNGKPKIIDFGFCQVQGYLKPNTVYNVGSPSYMSPESFNFNIYNEKSQIWSIGAIFYQCVTGKTLHNGQIFMEEAFKKLCKYGVQFPPFVSPDCKKISCWCLNFDPAKRPTVKALLFEVQKLIIKKYKQINEAKIPNIKKNRKVSSSTDLISFIARIRGSSPSTLNNLDNQKPIIKKNIQNPPKTNKQVIIQTQNMINYNNQKVVSINQIVSNKNIKSYKCTSNNEILFKNDVKGKHQNLFSSSRQIIKDKNQRIYQSQRLNCYNIR